MITGDIDSGQLEHLRLPLEFRLGDLAPQPASSSRSSALSAAGPAAR